MKYVWTIYDPQLDEVVLYVDSLEVEDDDLLDEEGYYLEEAEEILLVRFALQLRKATPFLEKYGLHLFLDERILDDLAAVDLSDIDLSRYTDDSNVVVEAIPLKEDITDCDPMFEEFPWISIDDSENSYPLYWKYDRDLRREKMFLDLLAEESE